MNEFGLIDYLIVITAVVVSWRMHRADPPPTEGENLPLSQPLLIADSATIPWHEPDLPQNEAPPLGEALRQICLATGYPGIGTFLDGAKIAYEAIIEAFARGEIRSQAYLLSDVVLQAFSEAIGTRQANGEDIELTFVGFRAADVVNAGMSGGVAWIDVRFVGEMVSVTRDREGRVVAGDPGRIVDIAEIWTFERELESADPNWLLTRTDTDE